MAAATGTSGAASDESCSVLITPERLHIPQENEICAELENPDVEKKINALRRLIVVVLNGEQMPRVMMTVIRYCITVENHELKKLLMVYWEVVKKYDDAGKLRPEMILVCNAIRNDLNHANEYIRGSTLRFLCRLRDAELLEPLVASIKSNLTHRHSYVRRNAVLAVYNIYRSFGADLMPDAPSDIYGFLEEETDASARRNAFMMLETCAPDKAVEFFMAHKDDIANYGDGFALVVLELARKVCRTDPASKSRFLKVIFNLLSAEAPAVVFEAAGTLVSMSHAPTAIRAAASAYTRLMTTESDNNVKLIVLEKLDALRKHHAKVLREVVMDILRALSSPNNTIRRKCLDIAMALVTARNVEEVVGVLKKELLRTQDKATDPSGAYRAMVVDAVHSCTVRFPEIAHSVIHILLDFMGGQGGAKVALLVREIMETFPVMRGTVLGKLVEGLPDINNAGVMRVALWILGEYSEDDDTIAASLGALSGCLGPLPLLKEAPKKKKAGEEADAEEEAEAGGAGGGGGSKKGPVVLADGTYASQSAAGSKSDSAADATGAGGAAEGGEEGDGAPPLRRFLLKGDYFTGSALASTLTKLALRMASLHGATSNVAKAVMVDAMLVMCAVLELGESKAPGAHPIGQDARERISGFMRIIADPETQAACMPVLLSGCRSSFSKRVALAAKEKPKAGAEEEESEVKMQADDLITVRQLRPRTGAADAIDIGLDDEQDLLKAAGTAAGGDFASRLRRVHQMSGFADPVYCEAFVMVHDYDVVLEMSVINRTSATMTNVAVELYTMGALKVVDRPPPFSLSAGESKNVKANIKVSSTEAGHIFGNIAYDSSTSAQKTLVNLKDINIDIMDYINPATTSDEKFREMWADFEWENKVAVNTTITNLRQFVAHIAKNTNMRNLTPVDDLGDECNFMAANLYARSIFGEDALANISIENKPDGSIKGHVRIRSKTQGVALSLGDRISAQQKP